VTATGNQNSDLLADLQTRLATLSTAPPSPEQADAAVLVLLRPGTNGLEVLAEQRAEQPGDPWSGQVGLPGGRKDPADHSLTETVLRELQEEVGLLPSALGGAPRLFGIRRARPSGIRVAVFAAHLASIHPPSADINASEVATTFWLPLRTLDQSESRPRSTMFGQIYVDTVVFEGHVVWGFTLRVLYDFLAWLESPDGSEAEELRELRPWRGQAL
jgi:8-oxo-dGTP pyrophosphatase MutT (NUDIX family)